MRSLHLIRHAPPIVDLSRPAHDWPLAPGTEHAVARLATGLAGTRLPCMFTSFERKAIETGRLLGASLDLPQEVTLGLEEHHRPVGLRPADDEDFRINMRAFFDQPDTVVFGAESAATALLRFHSVLRKIMDKTDADGLVVSHGAVMALLIAKGSGRDAWSTWLGLTMPDHVVLEWPSLAGACNARPPP